jgi:hypothetical protein
VLPVWQIGKAKPVPEQPPQMPIWSGVSALIQDEPAPSDGSELARVSQRTRRAEMVIQEAPCPQQPRAATNAETAASILSAYNPLNEHERNPNALQLN